MKLGYFVMKFRCKMCGVFGGANVHKRKKQIVKNYFTKRGITLGDNCVICSDIVSSESYLIEIGNNVTISNDVQLITHDNSIDRMCVEKCDVFGRIKIGDSCFVGAHSIILPGITIADKCIVGAGSVVTRSVTEPGTIVGGNPAKKIGTVEAFLEKYKPVAFCAEDYRDGRYQAIIAHPERVMHDR